MDNDEGSGRRRVFLGRGSLSMELYLIFSTDPMYSEESNVAYLSRSSGDTRKNHWPRFVVVGLAAAAGRC